MADSCLRNLVPTWSSQLYFPLFFSKVLFEGKRMGVILRIFREEKDEVTGLPIKEIRGYFIWIDDKNRISFIQLSASDVAISNLTDSETGKTTTT